MSSPLFVWLGSGRARRRKVTAEGQFLDQAARAGLPVPPGAILLDEFFRLGLDKGLIERVGDRVTTPDPELLHNTLFHSVRLPRLTHPVLVQPIRSESDSVHCVDADAAAEWARALTAAWSAAGSSISDRHDILIMEIVAAEHAGVVYCLEAEEHDQVVISMGQTDSPMHGLRRLGGWHRPDEALPPFARRLQMLLRGVRRTFGAGDRPIAWADDGHICWLIGLSVAPFGQEERQAPP